MARRKPRRTGLRRFLLSSMGAVEAQRYGDVEVVLDQDGIARLRKKHNTVSCKTKLAAAERLLRGLENNHWLSPEGKAKVREKLQAKIEELRKRCGM